MMNPRMITILLHHKRQLDALKALSHTALMRREREALIDAIGLLYARAAFYLQQASFPSLTRGFSFSGGDPEQQA